MKIRTLFLKLMLVIAAIVVAVFAVFLVWRLPANLTRIYHQAVTAWVMAGGLYVAVIGFYAAVYCAWQLLRRVDTNTAFSNRAVRDLRHLKWATCGITVGALAIMPQVYVAIQAEDAPGLGIIAGGFVALPLMVTIFLAVLERLWATALAYKEENELTI